MKLDRKVFRTAGGDLTDDRTKAAFVFMNDGSDVSPAELKRNPELGKYLPEVRDAEAAKRKAEAAKKAAAVAENKQANKPPNKAGGK